MSSARKAPIRVRGDAQLQPLLKIQFEGFEKISGGITAIAAQDSEHTIIKSCGGRSYGKNRKTTQKPQTVQNKDVKNSAHGHPEGIVHIKYFFHVNVLLSC